MKRETVFNSRWFPYRCWHRQLSKRVKLPNSLRNRFYVACEAMKSNTMGSPGSLHHNYETPFVCMVISMGKYPAFTMTTTVPSGFQKESLIKYASIWSRKWTIASGCPHKHDAADRFEFCAMIWFSTEIWMERGARGPHDPTKNSAAFNGLFHWNRPQVAI